MYCFKQFLQYIFSSFSPDESKNDALKDDMFMMIYMQVKLVTTCLLERRDDNDEKDDNDDENDDNLKDDETWK